MKKALFVGCLCLVFSVGFLLAGCGPAEEAKGGPQTSCPIKGEPIDKKIFVDREGKRVYLCCEDCRKTFNADGDAQIQKMTEAGVILEDTPK